MGRPAIERPVISEIARGEVARGEDALRHNAPGQIVEAKSFEALEHEITIAPRLGHHNIFFSDDYPEEFSEIHGEKISPSEPTIYLSVSSRTDPDHAPEGHDNYFILVNAPARDPKQPWTKAEAEGYRDLVLKRLERFGFDDLSSRIVAERIFTPSDFATRDLAHHGALYGWASHSIRTSLFRPPLRAPGTRNVFFTGGTTHPGGGIPLVLLSGKMVAGLVQREIS